MILAIQCLNRDSEIQEILLNISRKTLNLNNSQDLKLIQEKLNEEIEKRLTANAKLFRRESSESKSNP